MLTFLALISMAWAGECQGQPTSIQEIEAHVDDALFAFATLDEQGVYEATDTARGDLDCLSEPLEPSDAAAFHRLVGIRAFMEGDRDKALAAFVVARDIEPDYALSERIAPEGGRLYRLYQEAGEQPSPKPSRFDAPSEAMVFVDGEMARRKPAEAPAIVQYRTRGGEVLWTGYVDPGEQPPASLDDQPAVAEAPSGSADMTRPEPEPEPEPADMTRPEPEPEPEPAEMTRPEPEADEGIPMDLDRSEPKQAKKGGSGLAIAAVTTGVLAAGAFGVSAGTRASFDNDPTETKYHLTNGAYYTSLGLAGLTAGLTGAAFIVRFD